MSDNAIIKRKIGQVVATGSDQTATVSVAKIKQHRLYHKKYQLDQKFLAQNPDNQFKVGERVEILPCRPLSKRKHYIISRKFND